MPLYSDFDISFNADPASKDLVVVVDDDAVIQSVRTLVLTSFYERPFQPALGSTLRRILFEPLDEVTKLALAHSVKNTIEAFEPRVQVKIVDVYVGHGPSGRVLDDNTVVIVVSILIYNRPNLVSTEFALQRLR